MNRPSNLKGPGPGRPKGSQNKTNALLKDAIILAAQKAGSADPNKPDKDGLVKYLTKQANKCPNAFLGLIGKVLPTEVKGSGDGGEIIINVMTGVERLDDQPDD